MEPIFDKQSSRIGLKEIRIWPQTRFQQKISLQMLRSRKQIHQPPIPAREQAPLRAANSPVS